MDLKSSNLWRNASREKKRSTQSYSHTNPQTSHTRTSMAKDETPRPSLSSPTTQPVNLTQDPPHLNHLHQNCPMVHVDHASPHPEARGRGKAVPISPSPHLPKSPPHLCNHVISPTTAKNRTPTSPTHSEPPSLETT